MDELPAHRLWVEQAGAHLWTGARTTERSPPIQDSETSRTASSLRGRQYVRVVGASGQHRHWNTLAFTGQVTDASGLQERQRALLCTSPCGGFSGNISSGVIQCASVWVCMSVCYDLHRSSSWRRAYACNHSHPLFALESACVCVCEWVRVQVRWVDCPLPL